MNRRVILSAAPLLVAIVSVLLSAGCHEAGKQRTVRSEQSKGGPASPSTVDQGIGQTVEEARPLPRMEGKIVFTSERDGSAELYMVNLNETHGQGSPDVTKLTDTPTISEAFPAWSPSGGMILFLAREGTDPARLYLARYSDGKAFSPEAVSAPGHHAAGASWSPDGNSILYGLEVRGATEIMRYDVVTRKSSQLTTNDNPDGGPLWSTDGRSIYWSSLVKKGTDIWVMGTRGAKKHLLFGGAGEQGADCVIGGDLLGITLTEKEQWEVGILSLSSKRLIASTSNRNYDAGIRCGPDGKRVVWTSMLGARWDLLMAEVPAHTSNSPVNNVWESHNLTAGLSADNASDISPVQNLGPAWSPDSRFIAFESNAGGPGGEGGRHIYVVEAATGRILQVTDGPGSDRMPAWGK